jgi:phosphoribosylformylglycinamidine synthase
VAYGIPLISGKDSMKNDYQIGDTKISIPPTVLFSVIGKVEDLRKGVTMDVKRPGDLVYLLGRTRDELGASEYYDMLGHLGANVPKVDAAAALTLYRTVNKAQVQGLLASCHDLSDGGLGVALAEKAFAGGYGMRIELKQVFRDEGLREDAILFSETQSRLLVTVRPENRQVFEEIFAGQPLSLLGEVADDQELLILGLDGQVLVQADINELKEAWQAPLREM